MQHDAHCSVVECYLTMTTAAFYSPALRELPLKQPNELQELPICVVLADSV